MLTSVEYVCSVFLDDHDESHRPKSVGQLKLSSELQELQELSVSRLIEYVTG